MKLLIDKFYIVVILMITMLVGGRGVCRAQQINVAEIATLGTQQKNHGTSGERNAKYGRSHYASG